jgi:uncharacterized protein YbjT (DUF2867 family)
MSPPPTVLIFGPSGAVACAAAHEAQRRGASVHLAMRDTTKALPNLPDSLQRIQADLSDPASLTHAVQKSSATVAFVYTVFASQDHMASSFSALKSAGIQFVVLLSSFKVSGEPEEERNMASFIDRVHAQTESALKNSGLKYAAIRAAYFNSNVLWNVKEMKTGEVGLLYPDVTFDFLAPSDIGIVCGAILGQPKYHETKTMYLCGPEIMSQERAHGIIGEALGREIKVKALSEEQFLEKFPHMPRPALETLVKGMRESHEGQNAYPEEMYGQAVANIREYKEGEPMKLGEWVEAHKEDFE